MSRTFKLGLAASVLALMSTSAVYAQETTGGISGYVSSDTGSAVSGAAVSIIHKPTGITQVVKTDASGYYAISNLRVGGPYEVSVSATGYEDESNEVSFVNIGDPTNNNVTLKSKTATEVVVTARRPVKVPGRTTVGQSEIDMTTSMSRDIRDFALKSPLAMSDASNSGALQFGGMNNRSNAILVDGVKQGDDFGLNANGLPTLRSPISVDSVQAVSVDTTPYDVQYSFFQGAVMNFVTKSGGNEFHGGAFYEKTNDALRGKSFVYTKPGELVTTNASVTGSFEEKTYGAHLSGPIIKDKLFFFGLYEKFEGTTPALNGPSDSNATVKISGVTQANVDQISGIMKSVYNYDPLGWKADELLSTDEKVQFKLDYQINDNHRANFSYINTKSVELRQNGSSTSNKTLGLLSNWYNFETDLEVYKVQVVSTWNDRLSTEVNFSKKAVENISAPLAGSQFAEFQVYISGGTGSSVYLGPVNHRHANELTTDTLHFDARGKYRIGQHSIAFGYERETNDIFNLFARYSNGTYVFNSITDLQNRNAFSLRYDNAPSNVKTDAAASFAYTIDSLYAQDTWRIKPNLTVTAGLRVDSYTSSDLPKANPLFKTENGFTNARGLDGYSVWQPRFSFNWRPDSDPTMSVYGGFGRFQGGNAAVWISNSYSNTGNIAGSVSCKTTACPTGTLTNVDGYNVATSAKTANTTSANLGTGVINALGQSFEIPSVWKFSIGAEKVFDLGRFGNGYRLGVEYAKAQFENQVFWTDPYQQSAYSGPAPDGRPTYFGPLVGGASKTARQVVLLESADGAENDSLTFTFAKSFKDGWAKGLSIDASSTTMNATDINSGTSSTAASSYTFNATSNPNGKSVATSNFETDFIAKVGMNYQRAFFGDNLTSVRLFAQVRGGRPYSFTYNETVSSTSAATGMYGEYGSYASGDRQLLYVPKTDANGLVTATSDPLVTYKAGFDFAGFNQFLNSNGLINYAGSISPRNGFKSPDVTLVNLHVSQELPVPYLNGNKVELYMDVQNLGNYFGDEQGALMQYDTLRNSVVARNCQAAAASSCTAGVGNFYQYDSYTNGNYALQSTASVYQVKFGVKYSF